MKKLYSRLFFSLLALTLCMSAFVGCAYKDTEDPTEPASSGTREPEPQPTETQPVEETLDDSMFNIFYNKSYLCAFVYPDDADETVLEVVNTLKQSLSSITFKVVHPIKESELSDEYKYVIYIGKTSIKESKDLYETLSEREAAAKITGDKLIIAFDNCSSGKGIVKTLEQDLKKCTDKKFRLPLDYSIEYKALPEIDALPEYKGAGNMTKDVNCGRSTYMTHVAGASLKSYSDYCKQIEDAGFSKISSNEIRNNMFSTFVGENEYIYAYYTPYNNNIRVITGPIDSLAREDYTDYDRMEIYTPFIASIPQPSQGEGYILRLNDGRFIVFDGGYSGSDRVYETLRQLESGDITIAAWFISHPHNDHYMAFIDFLKNHGSDKKVTLQRVIHNFADASYYDITGSAGIEKNSVDVNTVYNTIEQYAPDLPVIKAHTGQIINFGSVKIEILYTVEDLVPKALPNVNDSSMPIRVTMHDQTIMLLADTCYNSGPIMVKLWGDYLKSDIMQVAHHGMWPSVKELYDAIQGKVLLFPNLFGNMSSFMFDTRWKSVLDTALSYADDIYISGDSLQIIELPYTTKNNKAEVLESLKNYNK